MRGKRGAGLLEVLVSLALLGLALSLVASLFRRLQLAEAGLQNSTQEWVQRQEVLAGLERQARAAVQYVTPLPGDLSLRPSLDFYLPDRAAQAAFFPNPVPLPVAGATPTLLFPAATLVRTQVVVGPNGLTVAGRLVSSGVTALEVQRQSGPLLRICVLWQSRQGPQRTQKVFALPLRAGWQ